jgi:hypothetical protein
MMHLKSQPLWSRQTAAFLVQYDAIQYHIIQSFNQFSSIIIQVFGHQASFIKAAIATGSLASVDG